MSFTALTLRAQRRILAATVVLVAIVFWRGAFSVFSMPKGTVILLGGVALAAVGAVRVARTRRAVVPWSPLLWPLAAFAAALVVAWLVSPNHWMSLVGQAGRLTGLAMYLVYAGLFLLAVRLYRDHPPVHLAKTFLVASVVPVLYGLMQLTGNDPLGWGFREAGPPMFSTIGNPNFFAAWVGSVAVLGLWGALSRSLTPGWRVFAGVQALLCVFAASASQSLQGPVAFLTGGALFGVVALFTVEWLRPLRWPLVAGGGVLGAGLVAALAAGAGPLGTVRDMALSSARARSGLWGSAVAMFADRSLLGHGLDMFAERYWLYRSVETAAERGLFRDVDATHSVPLDMLASGGLLLGGTYLAVIVAVAWAFVRGVRELDGEPRLLLAGFGGMWAAYQVQSIVSIDVPPVALIGWLSGGVVMALGGRVPFHEFVLPGAPAPAPTGRPGKRKKRRPEPEPLAPVPGVVGVGIAVVTALTAAAAVVPLAADLAGGAGRQHQQNNQRSAAVAAYARATALAPWDSRYPARQAAILPVGDALDVYELAWERAPGRLFRSLSPARVAAQRGQPELASVWYARALEVDGWKTPTVLREAGEHRMTVGDVDGAVEVYERAVELHPDDHGFWAGLGRALAADGDSDGARAALQRALELNPNDDEARETLQQLG